MATATAAGAVYDRGYRPYDGPRGGRRAATFALYRASIRRALGLRRSWRQKVAPFVLLAIVTVPAVVNVGIAYITRNEINRRIEFITYRQYVGVSSALLVFVALTAPDIVCPDRRQRVLPLLFARPLTGVDYVLAKVGALFTILFAFSFLPQLLLFVGQALVSDSALDYVRDNLDVMWQVPRVGRAARDLLRGGRPCDRVAVEPADRRGCELHRTVPRLLDHRRHPGRRRGGAARHGSAAALISVLRLPLYLRDLVFLGHIDRESPLNGVQNGGAAAVLAYTCVLGLGFAVLLQRYRWTER